MVLALSIIIRFELISYINTSHKIVVIVNEARYQKLLVGESPKTSLEVLELVADLAGRCNVLGVRRLYPVV